MSDLTIRIIGDPILRKKATKVEKIDDDFIELIKEMTDLMYEADGVGLAAPQVGISKRFFIMDDGEKLRVVINPEILEFLGEKVEFEEGCLSIPDVYANVLRPEGVKVRYINENKETIEEELHGYTARIFQHEYDHLDGILFVDKLSLLERSKIANKLNQLIKKGRKMAKSLKEVNI